MSRKPIEPPFIFAERRQKLAKQIGGSALILAAHPEQIRNHDVHHAYRQDSNFYFLTGFEEPDSILLFRPGMEPETCLFVRKKNRERETWDGFRFGPEGTQVEFEIDKVYPIEEFKKVAADYLKGVESLYYRCNKNPEVDASVNEVLQTLSQSQGRTGIGILTVHDADQLLGEMRVIKSEYDLKNMRRACEISAESHVEVMAATRPGKSERELQGLFIYETAKRGSLREGYGGIFASGANATTLHYVFNDQVLKSGDLLLVDAGAEFNYFTGDITRTYPINGKFNQEQAEVYEAVLKVQKTLIDHIKPGVPFQELHEMGSSLLTDVMLSLGLISGRKEDIIKANEHRKYYPHGIGHYLGLDVHDAGLYINKVDKSPRKLEEGMVFTIEPGIYIPADDEGVSKHYRGIGIRIEDNILVTSRGCENLSILAPKEIADLERVIGSVS